MGEEKTFAVDAALWADLSTATIYLMGISFILGSMVTVLILLLLDMIRAHNDNKRNSS